jgi:hypothetical protein
VLSTTTSLEIESWRTTELVPDARNPRKNDHAVDPMLADTRSMLEKRPNPKTPCRGAVAGVDPSGARTGPYQEEPKNLWSGGKPLSVLALVSNRDIDIIFTLNEQHVQSRKMKPC